MEHHFNVELAERYGILEAILIDNLCYWYLYNKSNEKNFFDGKYWTYNSASAFQKMFPYVSSRTIERALKHLEDENILSIGNYNELSFDRTKWYSFTDYGLTICHVPLDKMTNDIRQNDGTIPYIKPNNNINNNNINNIYLDDFTKSSNGKDISYKDNADDFFNSLWVLYPKKKGKGGVSKSKKQVLQKVGYDEMKRCIERYIKWFESTGNSEQFMMYGSTFFNSGYVDYLDENYENKDVITQMPNDDGWQ